MHVESEYLPGVVQCEIKGVTEAGPPLEAQAIAARTYLANYLERVGRQHQVPVGPRFQCWKQPRGTLAREAVGATTGITIHRGGKLISANYVSGTKHLAIDSKPLSPRKSGYPYDDWPSMRTAYLASRRDGNRITFKASDWTEILVTSNEMRSGSGVVQTPMARPVDKNRGALSQNRAICLADNLGYETFDILRYFYGDDISLSSPLQPTVGE